MKQYVLLVTPTILIVSALAILFECIPWLSGRFGDVAYFFLWVGSLGFVASTMEGGASPSPFIAAFDYSGMGYLLDQIRTHFKTSSLSIGASHFDPAKPPIVFAGMTLERSWYLPRLMSVAMPFGLLAIARVFFHRFDPARIRVTRSKDRRWLQKINVLAKPLAKLPFLLRHGVVLTDAMMTFTAAPWALLVWVGISIAAIANPSSLPIAFALTAPVVADIASRDVRAGTLSILRASPRLRETYVWWKLGSSLIVAFLMMLLPLIVSRAPIETAVGIAFIATVATALAAMTGNPKTFIVLFLTFWYLAVSDKGLTPAMRFGGIHGTAPGVVTATYAAIALVAVIVADRFYAWRLHRGE